MKNIRFPFFQTPWGKRDKNFKKQRDFIFSALISTVLVVRTKFCELDCLT